MFSFLKKKKDEPDKKKVEKPTEEHVICPNCYSDTTVEKIEAAEGVCPSCKKAIDLTKVPRVRM